MSTLSKLGLGVSVLALVAAAHGAALAADAAPAGAAATSDSQTVDTIVVTAQKRTQSLQDVPVVVTVVSSQLMKDSGVHDIKDLTLLTPGLLVTSTTSESVTTARIRGIGTVGDNIGLESSVGIVIDGVYRPRNGVSFGDLGELDHIEVLKGPQGSLFGKSTSAGVINIVTKQPTFSPGMDAEATVGNYGAYGVSASVNGPLIDDKLAGRLFFADRQRDGFYKVGDGVGPGTSSHDGNQNFYTLRGQLLFTPQANFDAKLIADYSLRDEQCCDAVQITEGATAPIVQALTGGTGIAAPINPYNRKAYANQNSNQVVEDGGVSLEAHWKPEGLAGATVTSITSLRTWKHRGGGDNDYTGADILYTPDTNANSDQFKTFSQELRVAGKTGALNWLVGGFYAHEELHHNFNLLYGTDFEPYLSLLLSQGASPQFISSLTGLPYGASYPAGQGDVDTYRQTDDTAALFTNETYKVTDKFEITVGLRYTQDAKDLNSLTSNTNGAVGCGRAATTLTGAITALGGPGAAAAAGPEQALSVLCLPFENPDFNGYANHQEKTESEWAGTIKASYRFNPQVLTYASYARGYKAGGFNLDRIACPNAPGCSPTALTPVNDTSFPGEFVDSYEAGVKSTLLDRKLLLNATTFYQTFTNFQLNSFTGLVFVVDSVPVVHSKGVDADFVYLGVQHLTVQGGVTYADTRYTHADYPALLESGFAGASGSHMSLAPLWSASGSATYTQALTAGYEARFNLGLKYSSSYNTGSNEEAAKVQKAYTLTNGRIVFEPTSRLWSVELWGENIFNTKYAQVAFDGPFQPGTIDAFLGAPATYGVTARVHY